MENAQIVEKLKGIIKPFLEYEEDEAFQNLNEKTDLINELSFDSVDLIEIVIEIEEAFDIDIEDTEIKEIKTVKDIVNLIKSKMEIS
jgi:acyl carrier protein